MNIMNYNIWNGFEQPIYRERFIEYIQTLSPDVLALQELCGFTHDSMKQLSDEMDYPYSILQKTWGYPVGILSKQPIRLIERRMNGYGHGFLHVLIGNIHLIVLHLSSGDPNARRQEAIRYARYLREKNLDKLNCILLGDFNSASPLDQAHCGHVETDVIQTLLGCGFNDAMEGQTDIFCPSFPTRLIEHLDQTPARIDLQLLSKTMVHRLHSASVLRNESTDQISDHYPLMCEYH